MLRYTCTSVHVYTYCMCIGLTYSLVRFGLTVQHFHKTLAVRTFSSFFLRGSQERKDLALNPKRVSLVVGKDQQRTCAVMGRKCRVKPVVPRLPGQTFHWSKSADLWVCVSLSFPGAPRKKKVEKCALPRFCEIAVKPMDFIRSKLRVDDACQ